MRAAAASHSPAEGAESGVRATLAEEVARLIMFTKRRLWNEASKALEARGESMLTWVVITHLVKGGPSIQRDLACSMAVDPAGVSRMIEQLAKRGLVRTTRDRADRRKTIVEATAKG